VAQEAVKKMSAMRRVGGFLLIGLVMVGGFAAGYVMTFGWRLPEGASEAPEAPSRSGVMALMVVLFVMGVLALGTGVGLYGITLGTRCFTSDFSKPFWVLFARRLRGMNIVVPVLIGMGIAGFVGAALSPIMAAFGLPPTISLMIPLIGSFILVQGVTLYVDIWKPLNKTMVVRRLAARGISEANIERGIRIGISDPDKKKDPKKKTGMVEHDVGMLWLLKDALVYKGDTEDFRVWRQQLVAVERAVDAKSMSAYFGNVHVIIRFTTDEGTERRVRLHSEGGWTMSSKARASDELERKLMEWKEEMGTEVSGARC